MRYSIELDVSKRDNGSAWVWVVVATVKTGDDIHAKYEREYRERDWLRGDAAADMVVYLQGELGRNWS